MKKIEFTTSGFEDSEKLLNNWLGRPANSESVRYFNEATGKGLSFLKRLENGFYVSAWDYILKEDTMVSMNPGGDDIALFYTINYLLTSEAYQLELHTKPGGRKIKINILNNLIFQNNKTSNFSFNVREGERARALDIAFSHYWLMNQFPVQRWNEIEKLLKSIRIEKQVLLEPISMKDYMIVTEVLHRLFTNDWDTIFLKSKIMGLVNEVLYNLLSAQSNEPRQELTVGQPTIMKVKEKLDAGLTEKLPDIKTLATEFSMSESTLNRRFKLNFGKPIYEYYLEKRMELAMRMLGEKGNTISQVAYLLGYEKAGSFSKSFKKHFGVSPGEIQRKRRQHF